MIEQEVNSQLIVVEPIFVQCFYFMVAYCDFNQINGGKVVPYYLQGMSTNSYFQTYKYVNHVY